MGGRRVLLVLVAAVVLAARPCGVVARGPLLQDLLEGDVVHSQLADGRRGLLIQGNASVPQQFLPHRNKTCGSELARVAKLLSRLTQRDGRSASGQYVCAYFELDFEDPGLAGSLSPSHPSSMTNRSTVLA